MTLPHSTRILPLLLALAALCFILPVPLRAAPPTRTPVILDTDIGDDIDDTWALALLLKSPELDLKLVVGDWGKPAYRAKLLARFLTAAGRTDVAVGVGINGPTGTGPLAKWVENYDLKSYPGHVAPDGVQALIDLVMASPEPVTIIGIGPPINLAEALKRQPQIATKAHFVGMFGSVRRGYDNNPKPAAEWNVHCAPQAAIATLSAAWDVTITPLDTCGIVHLRGPKYQLVRDSTDPVARTVIENYRLWSAAHPDAAETGSSTLFDTVAIYLAISHDLVKTEPLSIRVTNDGMTVIDPQGKAMQVATEWKDLPGFEDLLVRRLTGVGAP